VSLSSMVLVFTTMLYDTVFELIASLTLVSSIVRNVSSRRRVSGELVIPTSDLCRAIMLMRFDSALYRGWWINAVGSIAKAYSDVL
jgi:hypothetical protein